MCRVICWFETYRNYLINKTIYHSCRDTNYSAHSNNIEWNSHSFSTIHIHIHISFFVESQFIFIWIVGTLPSAYLSLIHIQFTRKYSVSFRFLRRHQISIWMVCIPYWITKSKHPSMIHLTSFINIVNDIHHSEVWNKLNLKHSFILTTTTTMTTKRPLVQIVLFLLRNPPTVHKFMHRARHILIRVLMPYNDWIENINEIKRKMKGKQGWMNSVYGFIFFGHSVFITLYDLI